MGVTAMRPETAREDKVTIKIPRPLYEKIRAAIRGAGYNSVTDFVVYVLRDILASRTVTEEELSPEALQQVKERLRRLGYL
jgi:Arc/MetJ-type ribon-helix-helix transcriptional regulator